MIRGMGGASQGGIPFLMFHGIDSAAEPSELTEPGDLLYVLDEREFGSAIAFLKSEGYRTIRLADFLSWQKGTASIPERSVLITFDDGHESNVGKALPVLARSGFVAEFFITTGNVGKGFHVSAEGLRALRDAGMGIGSHSVTHPMMNDLPDREIDRELRESKRFLEDLLGMEVGGFSVPGGRVSGRVTRRAKEAGYDAVLTSLPGTNGRGTDPYRLKRIPVRRGAPITRAILDRGDAGKGDRLVQGFLDLGKKALGNAVYDRVRARILRGRKPAQGSGA